MKTLCSLFAIALVAAGCATAPTPRYTIGLNADTPKVTLPSARLEVRMAEDLRAYASPIVYHTDGTITVCNDLRYYAPLELALQRALEDQTAFAGKGIIRIVVRDYCVDLRGDKPVVRVTLAAASGRTATATAPLSADWDSAQLRAAFAQALYEAYQSMAAQ